MATLFIDFERYEDKNVEVAALLIYDNKVIDIFHRFILQDLDNGVDYINQAKFCHCIPKTVIECYGIEEYVVTAQFLLWISQFSFDSLTIMGNGEDTTREYLENWCHGLDSLPNLSYEQVVLHPWVKRQYEIYHIVTHTMKTCCSLLPCSYNQHFLPHKRDHNFNHSKMARLTYGFHCALFDCFELAFFENLIPTYCCDLHFRQVIVEDNSMYLK